jgi:protein SCO1/2
MKRKYASSRCFPGMLLLLALAGCHSGKNVPNAGDPASHAYAARGVIEQISPDHRQVSIHHQAIPGYMMEMTMDFPVNEPGQLSGLFPGDTVNFTLVVDADRAWVDDIQRTGHVDQPATPAKAMADDVARLKLGDRLPEAELLAEDGRTIHLSDFHGRVLVFTFFFTRCPLPNYCPLINRNFAETRQQLLSTPNAPGNWQFLSISFDPDFDRSEALASYAEFYRSNNADRWLFASAPPAALATLAPRLGLMIMGQGGNTTHNLRTVVVDPQGRLYRQFNDNLWTPPQLADAILEAARLPAPK